MKESLHIVTLHFIFKVPWEPRWKRSCILIEIISSRPICLLPSLNLQHVLPYARMKLKRLLLNSSYLMFWQIWIFKLTHQGYIWEPKNQNTSIAFVLVVVEQELGCYLHGYSRMEAHRVICSENLAVSPSPTNQLSNQQRDARMLCFFFCNALHQSFRWKLCPHRKDLEMRIVFPNKLGYSLCKYQQGENILFHSKPSTSIAWKSGFDGSRECFKASRKN